MDRLSLSLEVTLLLVEQLKRPARSRPLNVIGVLPGRQEDSESVAAEAQ